MHIFISWSGEASRQCAEVLREWLPFMNQAIEPFVSSRDISKGERGLNTIADRLKACTFGIVCVTRENQSAPWINFESGALSRELGDTFVAPFLLDLQVKDLASGSPLTQFQATDASNKEDVWAMVQSVNERCEPKLPEDRLRTVFDKFWGELASGLAAIHVGSQDADATPQRETSDILDELVKLAREQNTRIGLLEKAVGNSGGSTSHAHYTFNEPREVRIGSDVDEMVLWEPGERMARVASMAQSVIGPAYVTRMQWKGTEIEVHCREDAEERVRSVGRQLSDLAVQYRAVIEVFGPEGRWMAFPVF